MIIKIFYRRDAEKDWKQDARYTNIMLDNVG